MKRGARWVLGGLVGMLSIVGVPALAWLTLPVSHAPGPVRMEARPTSIFSSTFEVRTVNRSSSMQHVRNADIKEVGWYPAFLVCENRRFSTPREPGYSKSEVVSPGAPYGFNPVPTGLHRLKISKAGEYTTDLWVLNLGGRIFAVK